MKPHGLDLILKEEILENGKVVDSFINKNTLEAWIELSNSKTGKTAKFPMRSFVSIFINKVHGLLSGDEGEDTKRTSVSAVSVGASTVYPSGLQIGTGNDSRVTLSDTALEQQIPASVASLASLGYGVTTFTAPYEKSANPVIIESLVKRLFSNNDDKSYYINEIGLVAKNTASTASEEDNQLLSRDFIYSGQIGEGLPGSGTVNFIADSDMRIDFRFQITHGATGGLLLNFMRLIYNLIFKADPNDAAITNVAGGQTSYTYASGASADASSFFSISGTTLEYYRGIVVGLDDVAAINADFSTFGEGGIKSDEFTLTANTISAVTGGKKFSISRTFTNDSNNAITLDKVGIMGRGEGTDGTTLDNDEFLMAANIAGGSSIVVQPSQTYRITYTFAIQV